VLLWRPSELWSDEDVSGYFSSRPRLWDERAHVCDPTLLRIVDKRYDADSDELQCLCVLSRCKMATGLSKDRGRSFWINYRDLLLNPDHAAELEKFEASSRPQKKKGTDNREGIERKKLKKSA
jgi:hypothetical protein